MSHLSLVPAAAAPLSNERVPTPSAARAFSAVISRKARALEAICAGSWTTETKLAEVERLIADIEAAARAGRQAMWRARR